MGEKLSFPRLFLPTVSDVADRPSVSTLPPLAPLARRVRGVLFDMCNIFYDDTEWRRWLLRLLTQLGLQTNDHSFFHVWDRDYFDQVCRGRTSFREAFQSFLFSAGMSRGQIEEVQAACRTHRRMIDVSLRPLPGVTSTVARLVESGLVLGDLQFGTSSPRLARPSSAIQHGSVVFRSGLFSRFGADHARPRVLSHRNTAHEAAGRGGCVRRSRHGGACRCGKHRHGHDRLQL